MCIYAPSGILGRRKGELRTFRWEEFAQGGKMLLLNTRGTARVFWLLLVLPGFLCLRDAKAQTNGGKAKIYAQKLLEDVLAVHPEVSGLELASTPPDQTQCVTIASTEPKEIGEKCDKDEFTAMKTDQPFVEKEREKGLVVYDVTMPVHDSAGKVIATVGMDFRPGTGQNRTKVIASARQIAKELEARIASKEKLFEPAS